MDDEEEEEEEEEEPAKVPCALSEEKEKRRRAKAEEEEKRRRANADRRRNEAAAAAENRRDKSKDPTKKKATPPASSTPNDDKTTSSAADDSRQSNAADDARKADTGPFAPQDDGDDVEEVWNDYTDDVKSSADHHHDDDSIFETLDEVLRDPEKDLGDAFNDIFKKAAGPSAPGAESREEDTNIKSPPSVGKEDANIKSPPSKTEKKKAQKNVKLSTKKKSNGKYKMTTRSVPRSLYQKPSDSSKQDKSMIDNESNTDPANASSEQEQELNNTREKTARAPGGIDEKSRIKTRRVVVNDEQAK